MWTLSVSRVRISSGASPRRIVSIALIPSSFLLPHSLPFTAQMAAFYFDSSGFASRSALVIKSHPFYPHHTGVCKWIFIGAQLWLT